MQAAGGNYTRFQLRVEPDGRGLLLANASASARMSPTGVSIAKALLDGIEPDQVLQNLTASYRGASREEMEQDVNRVNHLIRRLGNPEDNYPIVNLEDAAVSPYEAELLAPLEADIPLDSAEKLIPILDRLWEVANTIFVRKGAPSTGNGSSWQNAYPEAHQIMRDNVTFSVPTDIWIAKGTYQPSGGDLYLKHNARILGGFAGNEINTERNISNNPTIFTTSQTTLLEAKGEQNIYIEGITIDGVDGGSGIIASITGATLVTMDRMIIKNTSSYNTLNIWSTNLKISNSTFSPNTVQGYFLAFSGTRATLSNTTIYAQPVSSVYYSSGTLCIDKYSSLSGADTFFSLVQGDIFEYVFGAAFEVDKLSVNSISQVNSCP
jgi:hypothetical protein